ncbi:glutaminyl-peptide cyclotransferase [Gramella sp. AN32]|uniref:Glutaminyl-peptide cyclotransferase n=1 Tax=Christiangramia antarctica TaxID=2058158 RepID=A0ABW5X703_9FLAO|nr:glutaminyl-peptide cyclotransferase [Gramella sp. AN32]MCM4154539.1 glutamine cyclotransferase [Gramella sp. AN32]
MKKFFNFLLLLILNLFIFSCGSNSGKNKSDFSLKIDGKTTIVNNETLTFSIKNDQQKTVDSVAVFIGKDYMSSSRKLDHIQLDLNKAKLGNQSLTAIVYYEGKKDSLKKDLKILNNVAPKIYTYEIINTYPHDVEAYTQGFEFHGDTLYESIGQYGKSKLRKVQLKDGKVLEEIKIDEQYFAEGLTILNDKLYQLTWKEGIGFIYNLNDFKKTGSFAYNQSEEGWGLCNDGQKIYKSDGTEKIWILNPENMTETYYIQPTTNTSVKSKFNELEWIQGKIYANTYQFPSVAIINPKNGAIEGLINFKGLIDEIGNKSSLDTNNDVLNGIAYKPETDQIFVTGKRWDTVFEIRLIEK